MTAVRRAAPAGLVVVVALAAACSDAPEEVASPRLRAPAAPGVASAPVRGRVSGTGSLGLRVRAAPTTASDVVATLDEGAVVSIVCRVDGESIDGNRSWNRVEDGGGGYVADAFIDMGASEPALPRCDGGSAPPPVVPPGASTAVVEVEGPAVQPHVQLFANDACRERQACRASTYRGHQPSADLALDFPSGEDYGKLPTDGHAFGDALAEFAVANRARYRIEYVIYRQRINLGEGWRGMEDRGSITQNHFDHVHVSFEP
jgi:hypothetical protein